MKLTLFHGTSEAKGQSILDCGELRPCWDGFTYLTDLTAPIYAFHNNSSRYGYIFKVTVEAENLFPDPDYLGWIGLKEDPSTQIKNKGLWADSLKKMRQVAHHGPIGIVEHLKVDLNDLPGIKEMEKQLGLAFQKSKYEGFFKKYVPFAKRVMKQNTFWVVK